MTASAPKFWALSVDGFRQMLLFHWTDVACMVVVLSPCILRCLEECLRFALARILCELALAGCFQCQPT